MSERLLYILAVTVAALCMLPVLAVVIAALTGSTDSWLHLTETVLPRYTLTTLKLVLLVALGTFVMGTTSAWLVTTCRFPGVRLFEVLLALPLAFPAYVLAYAYTDLLDHPGCPFGSTADVLSLVSAVNRPQLRINLDLYHTQIGEGDLVRWCEKCLPWIGEVQVADNPGRCEPGTGEINYAGVARALNDMGYCGPVGMEAGAAGDPEAALEAFRAAFTI